ncbi:PREDICTED: putative F-box protein At3g16210 [Fragaria vesca subsp. vesca]|uniref:putative F-box protein At3g16210 n=1 Tax=Fragaria vesca subsp. vesca TaxID=101020 RepID=UPI0002C377E9|nr:PREDICTED: putative F-box protein At3g16210 [Fragaria vesca subsp. vesca]
MRNRANLGPNSRPALKLLWMIRKRKQPSLSFLCSTIPDGCAAVLTGHEDVVVEILARLPVKTLMRFRCVCTTWRSLIGYTHFVKKHMKYDAERGVNDADMRLLFSMKPPSTMGLVDLKDAELDSKTFRDDGRVPVRELEFPVCLDFVSDIVNVGSCNGIICVHFDKDYVLWNPCTGEHNVLPKPSGLSCYPKYYGFGYDEINDDYKVVLGSHSEYDVYGPMEPMIQVFSLRRGTWNTYPGPRNSNRRWTCMRGQGGFLNGVLHWLWLEESSWDTPSTEIMPFSLAEEKFLEVMPIPWDE